MLISCGLDNNCFDSHEAAVAHFGVILQTAAAVIQIMDTSFADATSLGGRKKKGIVDDPHSFRKRTRMNASASQRQHFECPYSLAPT
jgi:hypothetical protein